MTTLTIEQMISEGRAAVRVIKDDLALAEARVNEANNREWQRVIAEIAAQLPADLAPFLTVTRHAGYPYGPTDIYLNIPGCRTIGMTANLREGHWTLGSPAAFNAYTYNNGHVYVADIITAIGYASEEAPK